MKVECNRDQANARRPYVHQHWHRHQQHQNMCLVNLNFMGASTLPSKCAISALKLTFLSGRLYIFLSCKLILEHCAQHTMIQRELHQWPDRVPGSLKSTRFPEFSRLLVVASPFVNTFAKQLFSFNGLPFTLYRDSFNS